MIKCDKGHNLILYEFGECPLCLAIKLLMKMMELDMEMMELDMKKQELA